MTIKRMATRFAAILLTICILLSVPVIFPGETVHALDYTLLEQKLNTWRQYICRTVMSLSLKDYYDTGVLPSITAGQFFYEGGCLMPHMCGIDLSGAGEGLHKER